MVQNSVQAGGSNFKAPVVQDSVQAGGSNFKAPDCHHSNKLFNSTFTWYCLIGFVDKTLVCDHSKKATEQYFHVVRLLCCTRWF